MFLKIKFLIFRLQKMNLSKDEALLLILILIIFLIHRI